MSNKVTNFIKNLSYTLVSNFTSMIISALVTLIVPKLIGVEEYGYWQLYLFYSSYIGLLHFGWNDGIYLRYGGKEYKELNKSLFFSQFYMLVFMQLLILIIIVGLSSLLIIDINKLFIVKMTVLCMLIVNVRYMLIYILQGTNRIKEYSRIIILDRIIFFCLIVFLLLGGIKEFKLMILADLSGKLFSLVLAMYFCNDIVFQRITSFYFNIREAIANISVGIKLMFANIASILIIGVVRFGIERSWDVTTFGKISLTLDISNFLMVFINAIGLVMFPILRRTDETKISKIYTTMRDFLMTILLGVLIIYYPFNVVLSQWLPNYRDSLKYMAVLLPICVFEGKMSLLINTYLKTLRKEKLMLQVNLISLCLSILTTFITTNIMKNLDLTVISIVVLIAFKCILSEILLCRYLGITVSKDITLELIVTAIFIISGLLLKSWIMVLIYGVVYILYLCIKSKDIKKSFENIKMLLSTK